MEEKLKQMFSLGDEEHVNQAKELARLIWEYPSQYHADMVDVIKSTLVKMHEQKIDSIKKI